MSSEDVVSNQSAQEEDELAVRDEEELKEPPRYAVWLHNDHYTTMEFVIEILTQDFRKSLSEAEAIMLKVHHEGRGVAGLYTKEIAETKVVQVTDKARKEGFPLRLTMEPQGT